jgi:hypothetical protein
MSTTVIVGIVLLSLALLLLIGILFFSFLKYLKRNYYPNWKFPDYASVGYMEYLFHKYIKRDLKN